MTTEKLQKGRLEDVNIYQDQCQLLGILPLKDVVLQFTDKADIVDIKLGSNCMYEDLQAICNTLVMIRRVCSLSIYDLKIGMQGLTNIAEVLIKLLYQIVQNNQNIRKLVLDNTDISPQGIQYLLRGITYEKCNLIELEISNCRLGANGIESLAMGLQKNFSIKRLTLNSMGLFDQGLAILSRMLEANQTIQSLHLDNNGIALQGMKCLSYSLLINKGIQELKLNQNPIGDQGFMCLSNDFIVRFQRLYLDQCKIGTEGMEQFIQKMQESNVIYKSELQLLSLSNNKICTKGAKHLFQGLQNAFPLLRMINLTNNKIGIFFIFRFEKYVIL